MQTEWLPVAGKDLEYVWYGSPPGETPTLIFLHEGLGCRAMWRDFPERLAAATGCGALVYSRAGYGKSDAADLPRSLRFMHDEALTVLPQLLEQLQVNEVILVGHSDGGSIALIYAGAFQNKNLRGLILEAPHVFVEDFGLRSIRALVYEYLQGNLKSRLGRYHGEKVDETFWGWNDIWLHPDFKAWNIEKYLQEIEVPMLVIQGQNDEYGTLDQVKSIETGCRGPVQTVILPDCAHSPHFEEPDITLREMATFIRSILETASS